VPKESRTSKYALRDRKLANGTYRVYLPSRDSTLDVGDMYAALALESAERILTPEKEKGTLLHRAHRTR